MRMMRRNMIPLAMSVSNHEYRVSSFDRVTTRVRARTGVVAWLWMCVLMVTATTGVRADDWPEIGGKGRQSVWNETGIIDAFPANGLTPAWRTPINGGYAGPSVANGRVFVADAKHIGGTRFLERLLALDETTGKILW